jgi:hypothetical protein
MKNSEQLVRNETIIDGAQNYGVHLGEVAE